MNLNKRLNWYQKTSANITAGTEMADLHEGGLH